MNEHIIAHRRQIAQQIVGSYNLPKAEDAALVKSEVSEEEKKDTKIPLTKEELEAVKKAEDVKMDKEEFIDEHKKLVNVLESPSHEDDKEEAKKQKKELDEETKKAMSTGNTPGKEFVEKSNHYIPDGSMIHAYRKNQIFKSYSNAKEIIKGEK